MDELNGVPTWVVIAAMILAVFLIGWYWGQSALRPLSDSEIAMNMEQDILHNPLPNISIFKNVNIDDMKIGMLKGFYIQYSFQARTFIEGIGHDLCYVHPPKDYVWIADIPIGNRTE